MKSLLSSFLSHFRYKPEDLFTEGICYILNESYNARKNFINLISSKVKVNFEDTIQYKTQVSGKELERPDMIGFDSNNFECIICEFKFWASLTDNQPNAYIERLVKSEYKNNKTLCFICPNIRKDLLWNELMRRINCNTISNNYTNYIEEKGVYILLLTTNEILNIIESGLISENAQVLISDLYQLRGLSDQIEEDAVMPLTSEEFSPYFGKRISQLYLLIDKIANKLEAELNFSSRSQKGERLKRSPQKTGYKIYLMYKNISARLELNFEYWYKKAETPVWIGLKNGNWEYSQEIWDACKEYEMQIPKKMFLSDDRAILFPLYLMFNCEEDKVINNIVGQIKEIFDKIEAFHKHNPV